MPVLTSKGQVTIPKSVRDRLHVKAGDSVTFEVRGETVVVKKEERKSILSLGGIVRKDSFQTEGNQKKRRSRS